MDETTGKKTKPRTKRAPSRTPEGRMNQLINSAVNLAEEKLINGTASSQIISLLLNLATTKAELELAKMKSDIKLADAKIESMQVQQKSSELYEEVVEMFKKYNGVQEEDDDY